MELMFDAVQSEPRASGRKSARAPAASRGVVQTAWELMEALSTEMVNSLSAAFGNFDRVVGTGWLLLADAVLGPPLLERLQAHAIGLKARRDAGKPPEHGRHHFRRHVNSTRELNWLPGIRPRRPCHPFSDENGGGGVHKKILWTEQ
jgi:hypothetical protein